MFQLPSFMKALKFETPAPNYYNASVSCCKQRNNVCTRAGFMSKTQRGSFAFADKGPPPGHYDINESLVKQSPNTLMSCFKSKTNRGLKLTSTGPGPGYYNPSDCTKVPKKTLFPKNPILNFSAQPSPLPPKPPFPGPGQYEIVDYLGPCKQRNNVCTRAGFMSKTQRGSFAFADKGPPPGHYDINESLVKQSPNTLMSCFKSKTNRGLKLTSTGPGPGYYNPSDCTDSRWVGSCQAPFLISQQALTDAV
uniref:cDNA FLJ33340 fis, clone BRACE2001881 n=1 Tax=Homo sapiens TaxID=9606 RepID=Q8NBE7_HUMAN|nr:unnamed protein product [Homo sapiens]